MHKRAFIHLIAVLCAASACSRAPGDAPSPCDENATTSSTGGGGGRLTPLEAAKSLVGTYVGQWESFGLDESGAVVPSSTWTDDVNADDPVAEPDRAYVHVTDILTIKGLGIVKVNFEEGFLARPDGSAGDHYFTTDQGEVIEHVLGTDTFAFETAIAPYDLAQFNIPQASFQGGQHVSIRVLTHAAGAEVEWITRITTLQWMDGGGTARGAQFASMRGTHQRLTHNE